MDGLFLLRPGPFSGAISLFYGVEVLQVSVSFFFAPFTLAKVGFCVTTLPKLPIKTAYHRGFLCQSIQHWYGSWMRKTRLKWAEG